MHRHCNKIIRSRDLVLNNPQSFPDIFVAIFLGLELDSADLDSCSLVCQSWMYFINEYLWHSQRVLDFVENRWKQSNPYLKDSASVKHHEVRCFTGDDAILLCGLYNGNIEVWSRKSMTPINRAYHANINNGPTFGRRLTVLRRGHSGSIFCLAVNDDIIVSGSFDHTVCVWDRKSRYYSLIEKLNSKHTDMIYGVACNSRNQIVTCSHDATVSVWQLDHDEFGSSYIRYVADLNGHVSSVKAVDCDVSHIVTASRDRTMKVWAMSVYPNGDDATTGGLSRAKPMTTIRLAGSPSCVSLLGDRVVVGVKSAFFADDSLENQNPDHVRYLLRLYDIKTGNCLRVMHGHEGRILVAKMDPISGRILSGDETGHILVWISPYQRATKLPTIRHSFWTDRALKNFDLNEMPANIIDAGHSKVVGLVLSGLTGFILGQQKGAILNIDVIG